MVDGAAAVEAAFDEARRQQALDALGLVDAPKSERFDRITRLAQEAFGVPMVSITLLDRDRQWRMSEIGLGGREAPREDAFCDATVRQAGTLVVEDAHTDPRFSSNPFVTGDPHLRFYAGRPLQAQGGEPVGTLCILDTQPRVLDDRQRALLEELALWVQTELTREREVEQATVVQRALMPRTLPVVPGYTVAGRSTPAGALAGDFYDLRLSDGRLRVTLADVMGKGTGPAIVAAAARAALRTAPERPLDAAIAELDALLEADLGDLHMFVTAFHADVDPSTGDIAYVDAGHSLAFILRVDGSWESLRSADLPLGMGMDKRRTLHGARLEPGDAFVCCSDGLLDILDLDQPFGDVAEALHRLGPAGAVEEAMRRATAVGALDDVTVVVIRRD
jgi:hypothetical protein